MIVGLGTDIVVVDRIRRMVENHSDTFTARIYTEAERENLGERKDYACYYAGRWAAKEALSKALGSGIGEKCAWHDISITNGDDGRPHMELSGRAAETARQLGAETVHVSISHTEEYASATVILEAN